MYDTEQQPPRLTIRHVPTYICPGMQFVSPYQRLQPAERAWVDMLVREIEQQSERDRIPLAQYLSEGWTPPPSVIERDTHGFLQRQAVQYAIYERVSDLSRELTDLTPWAVVREMKRIAMTTMGDFVDLDADDQPFFNFTKVRPEHWSAVKSLEIKRGGKGGTSNDPDDLLFGTPSGTTVKLQLHDKLAAARSLLEAMGVLSDPNALNGLRGDRATQTTTRITTTDSTDAAAERYAALLGEGR